MLQKAPFLIFRIFRVDTKSFEVEGPVWIFFGIMRCGTLVFQISRTDPSVYFLTM